MAATLSSPATRLPLVVILGATGTGKSKLALEIAARFQGEIISADSMQVYKGLDIITNKVTAEEASRIPHHLLDFLDPLSRYTVTDFRNTALPLTERLLAQGKVPVVVGGTNYYIESLLWKVLIEAVPESANKLVYERDCEVYGGVGDKKRDLSGSDRQYTKRSKVCDGDSDRGSGALRGDSDKESGDLRGDSDRESGDLRGDSDKESGNLRGDSERGSGDSERGKESEDRYGKTVDCGGGGGGGVRVERSGGGGGGDCGGGVWQETSVPTDVLYRRLQEVDTDIAVTYHPNERRKIIRSLQVWEQTGRPHSHLLKEQRQQEGGSGLGGALRYPHAVILWITCQQDVLLNRLDARVDEMIERGLLKELLDFHASYNTRRIKEGGSPADYTKGIFQSIGFKEFHQFLILPEDERDGEKGRKLYEDGVAAMKLATKQYTKKQLRWIKNRFLNTSDRKVPPLYTLDGTDPTHWDAKVWGPAQAVVQAMVEGRVPDLMPANPPHTDTANMTRNTKSRHECEVCQRVFIGEHIWLDHLRGAKHRKMVRRKAQQQVMVKQEDKVTITTTTES